MEQSDNVYARGLEAMKEGNIDSAIAEFEQASQERGNDYRIFNYLGAAYAAKGRYEKAIGAFKRAEQIAPNISKIHYNIAQAYEAVGILTEAEYEYEKALTLDPTYTRAKEALMSLKSRLQES